MPQDTRNDLAHLLLPRPSKAAKGNDLFRVGAQSLALLEALLLVDVGFDDSDIGEMLGGVNASTGFVCGRDWGAAG